MRKKVLIVATVYTHLAAFHKPFITMLQNAGFEVHAAASPSDGRKEEIADLGCTCLDIPFSRNPFDMVNNVKAFFILKSLLTDMNYSLIHVHTPIAAFIVRLASAVKRLCPVIYTAHGFHFFKGAPLMNWVIYYNIEKLAKYWTDALLVMNQEDYRQAIRMGFQPEKDLFLVNGVGVDLRRFCGQKKADVRREIGLTQNDLVVSCIAELTSNKNQLFLLATWPEIVSQEKNAHLLLIGTGQDEVKLKEYVKTNRVENVHFLGFRKDVGDLISISDIVTLVSKREGLPRCIMEAMACGKPVIVSDVRGSRDLVQHGVNGYVFSLKDSTSFTRYVLELLSDEKKRQEMGNAGKNRISKYSLENVLSQMKSIYSRYIELYDGERKTVDGRS